MPRERPYPNRYPDLRTELARADEARRPQSRHGGVAYPQSRGGGAGYPGY